MFTAPKGNGLKSGAYEYSLENIMVCTLCTYISDIRSAAVKALQCSSKTFYALYVHNAAPDTPALWYLVRSVP
jgi:hypothetical protein